MRDAGFSEEQIQKAVDLTGGETEFEVWPENWKSVVVFSRTSTQWRRAGLGHITGLDYAGVRGAVELLGISRARWRGIFTDIQVMEKAALEVLQKKAEERGDN